METRHIEAFLAVADELHFGRAAARLHLTQPSVSQQLKRLERHLGVELVSRSSRVVQLTPAGKAFRADAQRILGEVHRATSTAREIAAGRVGNISIGFNGRAGQLIMPRSLAQLHASYPNITTRLSSGRSGPQLAALARGELDVGLLYGRGSNGDGPLLSRQLVPMRIGALVGHGHMWANRSSIAIRELAELPCVMFQRDESPAMYDAIMAAAERAGVFPRIVEYMNDSVSTEIIVAARPYVGFASFVSIDEPRSMGLKVVPLVDPEPVVDLQAAWRVDSANEAVQAFLESLDATRKYLQSTVD
ncbi:LysR family transcriptional regulator [Amycolatopsis sp. GM8]|uniref:LysR family transcriptional regulator n=1 Tax=Amycolatopsis sp. GM8 TaxID=2896530 RepID=UPI001F18594F|nr:LysR family transcriptional regulator [Amycolatopsis sp. GM8]